MTTFPGSPRVVQGGLVLVDPSSAQVQRVIVLQYSPDSLSRTLQVQGAGADAGDRVDALRLKGPPIETIKLDAEIDATDQLELPDQNPSAVQLGIHPQLAALETIVYPSADRVQANIDSAGSGLLEITPVEAPLTLFVWSASRVLPVRISEFSITEEAFDPNLNPIRARVSLGMRVLNTNDLRHGHKGAGIFLAHHRAMERMAATVPADLTQLGIRRIP